MHQIVLKDNQRLYLVPETKGVRVFTAVNTDVASLFQYYNAYPDKENLGIVLGHGDTFELVSAEKTQNGLRFIGKWFFSMEDLTINLQEKMPSFQLEKMLSFQLVNSSYVFLANTKAGSKQHWHPRYPDVECKESDFDAFVLSKKSDFRTIQKQFTDQATAIYAPVQELIGGILEKVNHLRGHPSDARIVVYVGKGMLKIEPWGNQKFDIQFNKTSTRSNAKTPTMANFMHDTLSLKSTEPCLMKEIFFKYHLMVLMEEYINHFKIDITYSGYILISSYALSSITLKEGDAQEAVVSSHKERADYMLKWLKSLETVFLNFYEKEM